MEQTKCFKNLLHLSSILTICRTRFFASVFYLDLVISIFQAILGMAAAAASAVVRARDLQGPRENVSENA